VLLLVLLVLLVLVVVLVLLVLPAEEGMARRRHAFSLVAIQAGEPCSGVSRFMCSASQLTDAGERSKR